MVIFYSYLELPEGNIYCVKSAMIPQFVNFPGLPTGALKKPKAGCKVGLSGGPKTPKTQWKATPSVNCRYYSRKNYIENGIYLPKWQLGWGKKDKQRSICDNPFTPTGSNTPVWYFHIPTETILSDLGFWLDPQNHEILGFRFFDWWSDDHADDVGFAIYIFIYKKKTCFVFIVLRLLLLLMLLMGNFFNTVPTHDETHITNWNSSSARLRPSASAKRLRTDAIVMVVTRFPLFTIPQPLWKMIEWNRWL